MALVDRRSRSLVLRIAYDGPPGAGKASNLIALRTLLAPEPAGAAAPDADDRGPRFFDWLEVTGGWPGSDRVRCQLAVVPGQIELARRRRHILDTADAVVFVADSRSGAASETAAALRSLSRGLADRADVPIVLQANKQDLPGAQLPHDVHTALGLARRVPVVAARAATGGGVLEAFLLAVRLAVDHVRALLVAGELGDCDASVAGELLDGGAVDPPVAFDALDALARAAGTGGGLRAVAPPVVVAGDRAARAGDEPTRPIRVIRCPPVRTTTAAEARAMIDAAMQAAPPLFGTQRTAAPALDGTPIASIARAAARSSTPPREGASELAATGDTATGDAASSEATTRPLRMNRFTPAKAIVTRSLGPAPTATASSGPIPIAILAAASAPALALPASSMALAAAPPGDPGPEPVPPIAAEGTDPGNPPEVREAPEAAPTLVAVVAVEAHTIEAIEIEPIAIDAITIERSPVEPPASSPGATLLLAGPPPLDGGDDDPTWELPAVEPGAPAAASSSDALDGHIADAIARQDEPTAPIEVPIGAPPEPEPEAETQSVDTLAQQLPSMDLPAGMVWPGVSGRAALAAIAAPARVAERIAPWAPVQAIELTCGEGWSAQSSPELVFPDEERARQALADAVRWQADVASLTPPGRTYALSPIGDGVRLWVLTPAYRTLWTAIEEAFARGDRATATRLARAGLDAVDELRARSVPISDLDHLAVHDPPRLLATPWTPQHDRLIVQLQRLFAAAVL